jgi:hypothetical protein
MTAAVGSSAPKTDRRALSVMPLPSLAVTVTRDGSDGEEKRADDPDMDASLLRAVTSLVAAAAGAAAGAYTRPLFGSS